MNGHATQIILKDLHFNLTLNQNEVHLESSMMMMQKP